MTHARTKLLSAVGIAALAAAAATGCGNDVPAGAVAKVGDSTITKKEFDKWLRTAAQGQAQGGQASVPDPPDFRRCVSARRRQQPRGAPPGSDAQLRRQCRQEYDQLKGEVMQFLIQAEWVQQEAEDRGVEVSDTEVRRSFEDQKKQAFPNDRAYRRFLASSAMSEEDILFRVKLDTLQQKLTQKVSEGAAKVSNEDISEYYDRHKKRFAQAERRDLRVVLTRTERRAQRAKVALRGGQSWRRVARRYSIDEASKAQGGRLPDVTKGQQERALDQAVFRAKRGELTGPVKTQFGWYIFEVTKVTPASQQSLAQSRETIRNLLRSQRQQRALDDFIKEFREEYKDKTVCADDFRVAECKNAPKQKGDTGPASGGAPQGQPQPGQPQPGQPQPQPGQPQPQPGQPQPQPGQPQPQPQPQPGQPGGQAPPPPPPQQPTP